MYAQYRGPENTCTCHCSCGRCGTHRTFHWHWLCFHYGLSITHLFIFFQALGLNDEKVNIACLQHDWRSHTWPYKCKSMPRCHTSVWQWLWKRLCIFGQRGGLQQELFIDGCIPCTSPAPHWSSNFYYWVVASPHDITHRTALIKHTMSLARKAKLHLNPPQMSVLVVDQLLYALAKHIQLCWPDSFGKTRFIVMLRGLT